ncbi:MAG: hypothetical protein ACKO96_01830, partial [Flammeovirgaceae bacterium]
SQQIFTEFTALRALFAEAGSELDPLFKRAGSGKEAVFDLCFQKSICTLLLVDQDFALEKFFLLHFKSATEEFVDLAKNFDFGYQ